MPEKALICKGLSKIRKTDKRALDKIQGLVGVRLSGFESPLRHQENQGFSGMPVEPFSFDVVLRTHYVRRMQPSFRTFPPQ